MISKMVFLPAVAALALMLVPRSQSVVLKTIALAAALLTLMLSLPLLGVLPGGMEQESVSWIAGPLEAAYHVRVDGLSLFFVLLTTLVSVPAVWAAFTYADATRLRGYLALLLLFEWTLLGLFTAGNLLLFYIYWDLMLIPVFLALVGYSGTAQARRAGMLYLIYNLFGGLVLLAGVIGIVVNAGTFEVLGHSYTLDPAAARWLFAAFALAFLIKTPAFPFHAWMPPTYTYLPPSMVALVSGVQSKAGLYGLLVFAIPLFRYQADPVSPAIQAAQYFAPAMLVIAVVSIVYGALTAIAQTNAKTLVGYSSLSHLGFVLLALFAFGFSSISASILMIVSHGVIVAALFLLLGFVEERTGTNDLGAFGGLAAGAPRLAALMLIVAMAALGLPGLSGFAGEFLILIGAWQTQPVYTAIALIAVVLAAVYALRLLQGAMHGPLRAPDDSKAGRSALDPIVLDGNTPPFDIKPRELALLAPLVAIIFFLGIWPAWLNDRVPIQTDIDAQAAVHDRA